MKSLTLGLVFLFAASLAGQQPPAAKPEAVGMSTARLTRVDSAIQTAIERHMISGAVAAVARDGTVVYDKAFGAIDGQASRPMQRATLFRIASMTKPVTAVAALMLYEDGKFLLSDPVSKILPEFREARVLATTAANPSDNTNPQTRPAAGPLRIRQLFNHTAGFTYGVFGQQPFARLYDEHGIYEGLISQSRRACDAVRELATLPLVFNPGERFQYGFSNDVLGCLVEAVSGISLEAFMRRRIFEPLGMSDTYFFPPQNKLERLADYYAPTPQFDPKAHETQAVVGIMRYTPAVHYFRGPHIYHSGGGGLVSTVPDYLRFLTMLLNGGELERRTV